MSLPCAGKMGKFSDVQSTAQNETLNMILNDWFFNHTQFGLEELHTTIRIKPMLNVSDL